MDDLYLVDEDDNVIGKVSRKEAHSDPTKIHRVVHVIVLNSRNELVLEKRSQNVDMYKGCWIDVAGHVQYGESYEEAAKREIKEEIGVETDSMEELGLLKKRTEKESEIFMTFLIRHDGPYKADEHEIDLIRTFGIEEVTRMMEENESGFTPGFVLVFKAFKERLQ
jgi:isopentenyldiphosphate isomerase